MLNSVYNMLLCEKIREKEEYVFLFTEYQLTQVSRLFFELTALEQ